MTGTLIPGRTPVRELWFDVYAPDGAHVYRTEILNEALRRKRSLGGGSRIKIALERRGTLPRERAA